MLGNIYVTKIIRPASYYHLKDGGAEFVFATDSQKKRGWGERMFSSIGTSYMTGNYLLQCRLNIYLENV